MGYSSRQFKEGDLLLLVSPDKKSFTPVMFMKCETRWGFEPVCDAFDPEEGNIIAVYASALLCLTTKKICKCSGKVIQFKHKGNSHPDWNVT
jgi:hypothetical protein